MTYPGSAAARRLLDGQLSTKGRVGYVALLLMALLVGVAVGSLWLTEPALPARTHAAFATITVAAAAWAVYAAWVLRHRRPLFARHRVVAGWIALTVTSIFTIGSLAIALSSSARAAYAAGLSGVVMVGVAAGMLMSARRRFDELVERRAALTRELGGKDK